jgi:hypothetical protein
MIGIPERFAIDRFQTPMLQHPDAANATAAFECNVSRYRVKPAFRAESLVALEGLFAKEPGIGPNPPLLYAEL